MEQQQQQQQQQQRGNKERDRRSLVQKSLCVVLNCLIGEEVQVECKNDDHATGVLQSFGNGLDIELSQVNVRKRGTSVQQQQQQQERFMKDINKRKHDDDDDADVDDDEEEYRDNGCLESLFVKGNNVRFIHIPQHINITTQLSQYMRTFESRNHKKHKIVDRPKANNNNNNRDGITMKEDIVLQTRVDDDNDVDQEEAIEEIN